MSTLDQIATEVTRNVAILNGTDPEKGGINELYFKVLSEYAADIVRREGKTEITVFVVPFGQPEIETQHAKVKGLTEQFEGLSRKISDHIGTEISIKVEAMALKESLTESIEYEDFDNFFKRKYGAEFEEKTRNADIIHLCGGWPLWFSRALEVLGARELFEEKRYIMGFSAGGCVVCNYFELYATTPQEVIEVRKALEKHYPKKYIEIPIGEDGSKGSVFLFGGLGYVEGIMPAFHKEDPKRWPAEEINNVSIAVNKQFGLEMTLLEGEAGIMVRRGNFYRTERQTGEQTITSQVYITFGKVFSCLNGGELRTLDENQEYTSTNKTPN